MKRTILSLSLFLAVAGCCRPAADDAKLHFQAIGSRHRPACAWLRRQRQLHWIGGPLDGTYTGAANISGVWEKFTKAQGPLKVSADKLDRPTPRRDGRTCSSASSRSRCVTLTYREGKLASET